MANEEQILSILSKLEAGQAKLEAGMTKMQTSIDELKTDVTELKTDVIGLKVGQSKLIESQTILRQQGRAILFEIDSIMQDKIDSLDGRITVIEKRAGIS